MSTIITAPILLVEVVMVRSRLGFFWGDLACRVCLGPQVFELQSLRSEHANVDRMLKVEEFLNQGSGLLCWSRFPCRRQAHVGD